ncbi:ATP-binding protein [Rhodococcoides yunnanense]|uniref:ATP-binding protein n=1 Tax=Rhodococcoides yunnanense TaxID=278209 RepID=UPI0014739D08|nr:AAA family ATPase [Rhodococcus yunnanensis]
MTLDELASVIWPENRPKSWNAAVRSVISKVRQALEAASVSGDSVRSRRGYVQLVLPSSVTVDLDVVRESCRPGIEPIRTRADRAHDAHRLLAGTVLRGMTGAWADDVRTEFESLRIRALDVDAAASIELKAFDRAVGSAEALISLDPLHERAYRHAMRGYIGLGDRAQALDVAARCRRVLSIELGIDPSAETEELFLDTLRHQVPSHFGRSVAESRLPRNRRSPIGRAPQLDALDTAFAAAADGAGQFVVVTGDAGTGKTTLVLEALRRAQGRNLDVLFGRCSEDALVAFEPFVEAAGRELDVMGAAKAREWLEENGSDILRLVPGAANRFRDLMPDESAGDDRATVVTAVHRWLTGPSRSAPTVIVIDDVQWASSTTHALLRYLVQAGVTSTVCIVVTVRAQSLLDPEVNKTLNTATRLGAIHRIVLGELDVEHVRELVAIHNSSLDPGALHHRTGGHPLFVSSILEEAESMSDGAAPTSILEYVRRVEHSLSESARSLLQLIAVTGLSTSRRVLRRASPEVDDAEFFEAVDELVHARMVSVDGDSGRLPAVTHDRYPEGGSFDDDSIALRHPLVQEVVYSGIAHGRRSALHSIVGDAYADPRDSGDTETVARIAYHFSRGLSGDQPRARLYAQLAGDSAFTLGAYEDALVHYTHAVDPSADPDNAWQQCRALIGLGRARRAIRDPEARASALSALAIAGRLGDRGLQVEAVLASERHGMMFVQHYSADEERVAIIEAICGDMVRLRQGDTAEYAILLSQIGIEHAWDADYARSAQRITRAADIARSLGDGPLLARVSVAALIGLRVPHSSDVTSVALQDLDNLITARAEVLRDVTTTVWLMRARLEAGDLAGASATLDTITDAHIDGDPELEWLTNYGRMGLDLAAGQLIRSEAHLARIRSIPPSPTDLGYYGRLLPAVTALGTLRGDLQEIVNQSDSMAANFDANSALRPALAVAFVDVGDRAGAAELLDWYTPERVSRIPIDPMWLSTLTLIGRAAAQLSYADLCRLVYSQLSDHADCTVLTWASIYGVVHHHLAHLALGFGDLARAEYHVTDAVQMHCDRGFAAWALESELLGLQIALARGAGLDPARVEDIRCRAQAIGATATTRRLDSLMS